MQITEPIDVIRIRLSADPGATAVVSEFRTANRILAAWAAQARRDSRVDYEITFFDGLRLTSSKADRQCGSAGSPS